MRVWRHLGSDIPLKDKEVPKEGKTVKKTIEPRGCFTLIYVHI